MIITREKGMRMWGGGSGSTSASGVNGGGGFSLAVTEGEGTGNAYTDFTYESGTLTLNKATEFVTVDFFNKLFTAYDANGNVIAPNNTTPTLDNIKFMAGAWTEQYLSALGQNSSGGGGGGGIELSDVWQSLKTNTDDYANQKINSAHIPDLSGTYATKTWVNQQGFVTSSGVTSVAMTVPTGLSVSGTPITTTGTLALTFANGYSIPTTAKQGNWDTAYGWGNHASAGYASASSVSTLQGYFTNGIANTAAKLNTGTTTYTAWGQTYWSSGVPQSISGNMTSVGSITPSANGNALGTTSARFNIYGTAGNFSGNVSITGTLGVTGATTLTGLLTANGGIVVPSTKTIKIGDCTISWDSTNSMLKFDTGIYSTGAVSALGANSSGGGSGIDLEAMWAELQGNTGTYANAKINVNHIPDISSTYGYAKQSWVNTQLGNYVTLNTAQTITGLKTMTHGLVVSGRVYNSGDDEGIVITPAANGYAGITLGEPSGIHTTLYLDSSKEARWVYKSSADGTNYSILHPNKNGVIALTSDIPTSLDGIPDGSTRKLSNYLPLSGGTLTGILKWKDTNALPETTSPTYMLTIDSFANGGTTKWANLTNVTVGKATTASHLSYTLGNEINFKGGMQATCFFNYRNADTGTKGESGTAINYAFCNYAGETAYSKITAGTFIGAFSGNATTATTLQTPRSIWGNSFDGSANIPTTAVAKMPYVLFKNYNDDGNAGYCGRGSETNNNIGLLAYSGNQLRLGANGSTVMYISTSNNVGIGTDSPPHKFSVFTSNSWACNIYSENNGNRSSFYASHAGGQDGLWCGISDNSASGTIAQFRYGITGNGSGGTIAMLIRGNGNVGIGTNAPSQKLHVTGNILASGEVTASSDERLKTIVGDGNLDLRYIANAPNILFKWNNGQDDKVHGGSLAQYFLHGAKYFVLGSDKDYYSLNYGALATSMAISIAKEVVKHEDEITRLKKEVVKQAEEIVSLKNKVSELEERRIA